MSDPFFVRQTKGGTPEQNQEWFAKMMVRAKKEKPNANWVRGSIHPATGDLLIEVWETRPDKEGDVRWKE